MTAPTKRPGCGTPGCGRTIPRGGEGHPEICPTCLACLEMHGRRPKPAHVDPPDPIPLRIHCPGCHELHVDDGVNATTPHRTHACQHCGMLWAPATVPTVGVRFLPGCRNEVTT